ncbi:acylphosphatase [Afipia massiliensis]|uniref:acylphosphatase n=1 Tax=Afipia massiliensis TaxID=211460 RepID=A0A4U6BS32_9BRAD|nr:acylphosphatase [Afipia massiliensis]TKT72781.1 acylphosphatase [Afipia massiliensis]
MSDVIRHIIVRGKVQGVGYRAWLEDEAVTRDLAGWARNRRDGTVEAVLSGSEEAVAALIAKCQRGPGMARVTTIDNELATEDMLKLRASGERFSVLPTI